jgi:hypothetical protein
MRQTILFSNELVQRRWMAVVDVILTLDFLRSPTAPDILLMVAKLSRDVRSTLMFLAVNKKHKKVPRPTMDPEDPLLQQSSMLMDSAMGLIDDIMARLSSVPDMLENNRADVSMLFQMDSTIKQVKLVRNC